MEDLAGKKNNMIYDPAHVDLPGPSWQGLMSRAENYYINDRRAFNLAQSLPPPPWDMTKNQGKRIPDPTTNNDNTDNSVYNIAMSLPPPTWDKPKEKQPTNIDNSSSVYVVAQNLPPSPWAETQKSTDLDDSNASAAKAVELPKPPPKAKKPKPPKKEAKKRTRNENGWQRNIAQIARNTGQEYYDRKGNKHEARKLKECQCSCRYGCNDNFPTERRMPIFTEYWALGDYNLQTSFIFSSITVKNPQRTRTKTKGVRLRERKISVEYTLVGQRVCKAFFCATLDETGKRVGCVVNKKIASLSTFISPKDQRGRKTPGNRIPEERVDLVKEHIRSFIPPGETKGKQPKMLSSDLNIKLMHSFYIEWCNQRNTQPVKESFYRGIFNNCFNLKFKKPKPKEGPGQIIQPRVPLG